MLNWLRTLCRRKDGSVTVIGALALPALVGFVALVGELGHGLVTQTENQRVADLAAYAAAVAYGSSSSTTTMTSVAQNVAKLNGLPASAVTASLVTSPRQASSQAVMVGTSTTNVLLLAPILGFGTQLPVTAKAYAQIGAGAPSCMLALAAGGTGVVLSGGTSISASSCSVASNNTVAVPCGNTITAQSVLWNTQAPTVGCSGITGTISQARTADPFAANTGIQAAAAHASGLSSLSGPAAPSVSSGQDISFAYSQSSTQSQATAAGCAASFSGSTWTMTCSGKSTYNFGNITLGGGITVAFATAGAATNIYNFSGSISNSGTALTFGPGTYNVAKGITTGGGTTTTFGAGTYNVGSGASCNGAGSYSICNTGTILTFGGPSTFSLSAGVYNSGGSKLVMGSGSSNSYTFGASSDGNAIYVGGGATTTLADATGSGGVFQLVGNFNEGGGACTTLPAATNHDIKGYLSTAGGLTLGAGTYSVTSYIAFGASGGGDVSCNGTNVGVTGSGVTLVTAGTSTYGGGGSCSGSSLCLGSGFSNVTLSAPTSGTYANLVVVGPSSAGSTGGAVLAEGSSNTQMSGAFYFPNGSLALSGGASIGNLSGQCLQIVATQISLSGGTKASASSCITGASGGATTAMLVQ